jgi:hypothetical protein
MRVFGGILLGLALVCGCGDSASQACGEICSLPNECFDQLGVSLQGADCMQTCEAQAEYVGIDCLNAISSTIACLDTCDLEQLTDAQVAACQDEALGISAACD